MCVCYIVLSTFLCMWEFLRYNIGGNLPILQKLRIFYSLQPWICTHPSFILFGRLSLLFMHFRIPRPLSPRDPGRNGHVIQRTLLLEVDWDSVTAPGTHWLCAHSKLVNVTEPRYFSSLKWGWSYSHPRLSWKLNKTTYTIAQHI